MRFNVWHFLRIQPRLSRHTAFGLSAAALALLPLPASALVPKFDLMELRVEGSTALPQDQVEAIIYPFLGPGRTAKDVESARAALQDAYQKAGFPTVSVSIPKQAIAPGSQATVLLQVTERRVGRLRVEGARYFVPGAVRAAAPSLAPGALPNMHDVTRDLTGLNQLADRTVQPALRAGQAPDTVDVDLNVADKFPLHGSVELNNRYNADTTKLRVNASISYDNFWQRGDVGTLTYQVAPEDVSNAEISSASYLFHIPDTKLSLLLTYLHSNSNVTALGSTNVAGRGTQAGFRLLVPLGSTASFSHSFSAGWDYKDYYELDTFIASKTFGTAPVTYYPLNATYAANWSGVRSSTDLTLGAEFGLPAFGSPAPQFSNKAYNAPPGFSILRATLTREQELPHDVQLWASLGGQVSNDVLISSEQFSTGGADSVRGYLESETLGDEGVSLQTELRGPNIGKYIGGPLKSLRLHVFADTGEVHLNQAINGVKPNAHLWSTGVGARVNLWGYLDGTVQDAQALSTGPDTRAGTNSVLFRVIGEF